ncbi:hypothetical protein NEOLEDRAFT_1179854 [Neolentinus lepideus HHB14362 ss-1]|uniref:Uncharacterized protein n=1 Tax=Neolentinus lepideus HHB14362 ss-1 TaxID=1314782 RepID=A0A165RCI7_9AGAM|nr:hypothetical protein NEOLEDRAFT_1179854 [Neolentinus lepideus HHB14362 ss-1]
MTECKSTSEDPPARKSTRKTTTNKRLGSPMTLSQEVSASYSDKGRKSEVGKQAEEDVIELDSDGEKMLPKVKPARQVGGSRRTPIKPKKQDIKGKGKGRIAVAVDSEEEKTGSDIDKISDGEGVDDGDFPSVSELLQSTPVSGKKISGVTQVPNKIMVRGTKRRVEMTDDDDDEEEEEEGDVGDGKGDPEETKVVPKDEKSVKRSKTNAKVGRLVPEVVIAPTPTGKSKKGDRVNQKPPVDHQRDEDDSDNLPIVRTASDDSEDDEDLPKVKDDRHSDNSEVTKYGDEEPMEDPTLIGYLQDPLLKDTYVDLPLLRHLVYFKPSRNNRFNEGGQVMFSGWRQLVTCYERPVCRDASRGRQCQHVDNILNYIKSAITFERKDTVRHRYLNLSRVSPGILLPPSGSGQLSLKTVPGEPALCVSVVSVQECHLVFPKLFSGWKQKYLTGIFHTIEWERFASVVCTACNRTEGMAARLDGSAIQFSTRAVQVQETNEGPSTPSRSNKSTASLYSPSKSHSSTGAGSLGVLEPDDIVPVYDARLEVMDRPINFDKHIDRIPDMKLPRYRKEIRPESAVMVFYTVGQWVKEGTSNVALNIQWVVLLASPPLE